MIIKLANGTELNPITVVGEKRNVQGAFRDVLSFAFSEETSLDELDASFTPENCKSIRIADEEGTEYIYNNYSIRTELKRSPMEIAPATDTEEAVVENRVTVSMAQMTYTETQIAEQASIINTLLNGEV